MPCGSHALQPRRTHTHTHVHTAHRHQPTYTPQLVRTTHYPLRVPSLVLSRCLLLCFTYQTPAIRTQATRLIHSYTHKSLASATCLMFNYVSTIYDHMWVIYGHMWPYPCMETYGHMCSSTMVYAHVGFVVFRQ